MHPDQRVLPGGRHVHPLQPARDPQPGLVDVHHIRAGQPVTDPVDKLRIGQEITGPGVGGGDRTGRHRHPEQILHRLGGAGLRPEQRLLQIHRCSLRPCPVLHRGVHPVRRPPGGDLPAPAPPRHQAMLRDPHPDTGQIEHLPHRHRSHRRREQIMSTPAAPGRFMHDPHVGVGHLPQRAALMTRLPARPAPRPGPQRLRRRLTQPIRRRRPRRVRRILPQPGLQIRVLRPQHRVLLPQDTVVPLKLTDEGLQPDKPLQQLLDRRSPRHQNMIQTSINPSQTNPPTGHLTSHLRRRVWHSTPVTRPLVRVADSRAAVGCLESGAGTPKRRRSVEASGRAGAGSRRDPTNRAVGCRLR